MNFQARRKVYSLLMQVPAGKVVTYGQLANQAGVNPRVVGRLMRNNFLAPLVPCHRVIKGDLRSGGFQGKTRGEAVTRKKQLLAVEGVRFDERGKLLDKERLHRF